MKKITDTLMETIVAYMDDETREKVHFELAPCSNEEFLNRYIELDDEFKELLHDEFNIDLEEETTMKNPCKHCKYFNTCGDIDRTEPCNGKEENSYYFSEDNMESLPELMDRTFTQSQLAEVYRDIIDKTEYLTFEDWLIDMLKCGLVMEYK